MKIGIGYWVFVVSAPTEDLKSNRAENINLIVTSTQSGPR